jgi:N,N'-diacetyllegionaminate synthase
MRTIVIAEAGVNHNGSLDLAKALVDEAKRAGADFVKFQSFRTAALASRTAPKAAYQRKTTAVKQSQYDMLRSLELGPAAHRALIVHCHARRIGFLSSPFDHRSVDLLAKIGVTHFKIPSGEITNHPLLRHIASKHKPIILSTGMSNLGEVEDAVRVIRDVGNRRVTLLHCVTEYPAPYDQVNLRAMLTLKAAFGLPVGYSDHTPGIEITLAAVALGAEIVEKHFTLDRTMPGPDHQASLEPKELQAMIAAIRNVEASLGDGRKRPTTSELRNIAVARKSVVAARAIRKGEVLTRSALVIKRPGHGIQPVDFDKVLGLRAVTPIPADEVIMWSKLK